MMMMVQLAVMFALSSAAPAWTGASPPVTWVSLRVVQVRRRDLSGVAERRHARSRTVVRIRTTSATSVWEGDVTHGVGRIKPGDAVLARGTWLSSGDFAASYLVVDLVNEYGLVGPVNRGTVRLKLVDRNSLTPVVPTRYDAVSLSARTMLDGKPQRNIDERMRAGSLIQVIGVRTSATAVRAVNVLRLTGVSRHVLPRSARR
ncbi:MAG: hypothetical protein QOJ39_2504 [Candidatus Eremiobacteraeota bacterium]|jgi:hypothetical protein|nr:hypothetical protein [Candidatus Eremiobacteraeota bacterium]